MAEPEMSYFGVSMGKGTQEKSHVYCTNMRLDPRIGCALIVYEETAPVHVDCDGGSLGQPSAATSCDCGDTSCVCRFNITQFISLLPLQCHRLADTGACGFCPLCVVMRDLGSTRALQTLTHVYCAGIVVIQRNYLVPDYCNPLFKCLFTENPRSSVIQMEGIVWTKLSPIVKSYMLQQTLARFMCGSVSARPMPLRIGPLPRSMPEVVPPRYAERWLRTNKRDPIGSMILPLDTLQNTLHKHLSRCHSVHQKMFSLQSSLQRSKAMVGSAWMFLCGRGGMDRNSMMLLHANEHIRVSPQARDLQFEPQNVGEGSAFLLGDGEMVVSFPMIAMLHTGTGTALSLKAASYQVPLFMMHECVVLRICGDPVGTHKTLHNRGFLCYAPGVRSDTRESNAIEIANARHAVVAWPEVLFRLHNEDGSMKFQRPCGGNTLRYNRILPSFLSIFMQEHNSYARHDEHLESEILARFTLQKDWASIQNISSLEKYLLIMLVGTHNALQMLLEAKTLLATRKRKQAARDTTEYYVNMGHSIVSAHSVSFSLMCCLKPIYDMCFDIALNLLAVASGVSGWQNGDIVADCKKLLCIQAMLSSDADIDGSDHDNIRLLGDKVNLLCTHVVSLHAYVLYTTKLAAQRQETCACALVRRSIVKYREWSQYCLYRNGTMHSFWNRLTCVSALATQVLEGVVTLHRMHAQARCVLVSEIMCDAMYTLFFAGYRFTYCKAQSENEICHETSKLSDIVSEIKHRLGYVPELAKDEASTRNLMHLLCSNNLVFYKDKCNDALYEMRNVIAFAHIDTETLLIRKIRHFKNASRAHYSTTRRIVSAQHTAYKRAVVLFFADIVAPVRETCAAWLCLESARTDQCKDERLKALHDSVDAFEKATRL